MDINGLITIWLSQQPERSQRVLAQLIEDHFHKGLLTYIPNFNLCVNLINAT